MTTIAKTKTTRKPKINVLSKAHALAAKMGKTDLYLNFNMYRTAINMKPVAQSTFSRYLSGYKGVPDGTNPVFAAFIKAVK